MVRTADVDALGTDTTMGVARVKQNVLAAPFPVAPGVVIPPGSYRWTRHRLEASTAAKRRLSTQLTWWFGGFYEGTLHQVIWTGAWNPTPAVTVEFRY